MARKEALTQGTDSLSTRDMAQLIDHTLLSPTASTKDYVALCKEANEWNVFSICVPPVWVQPCRALLGDNQIKVCTVVGFPLGYSTSSSKVAEAEEALANGAEEIDMVMNLSHFKDGEYGKVEKDIQLVVEASKDNLVKVILETGFLEPTEITEACKICGAAGAGFVKTSTGFGGSGANTKTVKLMREAVGSSLGVKASGGIRNLQSAMQLLDAGANRLGTSKSVDLLKELKK